MKERIITLHSGGLDSTVCLLLAKNEGYKPISLGIDYNQNHKIELEYALKQCIKFKIERKILTIKWDKPKIKIPLDRTVNHIREEISSAFLPGRNIIFLSLAFAEAKGLGIKQVWFGANTIDFSGYPDCTNEFIESFILMTKKGMLKPPKLITPLLDKSKKEIAKIAYNFGLTKNDTWSCYRPVKADGVLKPCNRCDACNLNNYAWSFLN